MSHKILIVDDEPAIREALRRALRSLPYEIFDAGSGEEALGVLKQNRVDLILSDQNMPGMTGLNLLEEVRGGAPEVIRVLMTGFGDTRLAAQAQSDEVIYHFMQKPWDASELQLVLKLALRHGEVLRENERLLQLVRTQRRIISDLEQPPADPPLDPPQR